MVRTGAQIIWEAFVHEGVTTVFGYPGGAILPAYNAMLDYPIHHVLVRHEQGATHMADGFARASGGVGVAIATSGRAKFARPKAEVWAIVGDGGFQMTMTELVTIAQEKIKIHVAIINNGYLGMVRQWQEFFYERRYAATPLLNPDFAKLAEAFGLRGVTVDKRSDVVPSVETARASDETVVMNFKVEQEDTVYPMVPIGADLYD